MDPTEAKCPYCAETIDQGAEKCPFCGEWFDWRASHPRSIERQAAVHAQANAEAVVSRVEHREGANTLGGCLFIPFFIGGLAGAVWFGTSFWLACLICLAVWIFGFVWTGKIADRIFAAGQKKSK